MGQEKPAICINEKSTIGYLVLVGARVRGNHHWATKPLESAARQGAPSDFGPIAHCYGKGEKDSFARVTSTPFTLLLGASVRRLYQFLGHDL